MEIKFFFRQLLSGFLILTLLIQSAFASGSQDNKGNTVDPKNATPEQILGLIGKEHSTTINVTPKYDNPYEVMRTAFSKENLGAANLKATFLDAQGNVITDTDRSPKIKTVQLADPKSGYNLIYEPNFEKAFREWSPAVVSANYKAEGLDVELEELKSLSQEEVEKALSDLQKAYREKRAKVTFSDLLNIVNSTKQSLGQFPAEAFTFYFAVGTNHVLNLITEYHKNPMALEMFLEELKSPIGQLSFLAFMIGNRHAGHLLSKIFDDMSNPFHRGMRVMVVPYIGMAVGSIASSLTHDIFNIVAPCSSAIVGRNKYGDRNGTYFSDEEKVKVCTQAMSDFFSRDTAARYTASVLTVTASTAASSLATMAAITAKNKTVQGAKSAARDLRFKGFVIAKRDLKRALRTAPKIRAATKGLSKAAKVVSKFAVGNPIMFGIKIGSIVIFLQSDEFFHPKMHHFVELIGNSGPLLRGNKARLRELENYLKTGQDNFKACAQSLNNNFTVAKVGIYHSPAELEQKCDPYLLGISTIADANNKHKKWRKNLMYEFDAAYAIWARFFDEYSKMTDAGKDITYRFLVSLATMEKDAKDPAGDYNPLVHNNPLNGVLYSEKLNITEEDYSKPNLFDKELASRALKVVELLPQIDSLLNKMSDAKKDTKIVKPLFDEYEKPLLEVKDLITKFRTSFEGEIKKIEEETRPGIMGSITSALNSAKSYFHSSFETAKKYLAAYNGTGAQDVKTPLDRTKKYEVLGDALRVLNRLYMKSLTDTSITGFNAYSLYGSKNIVAENKALQVLKETQSQIKWLRRFLGEPQPVRAVEALVLDFNDQLQTFHTEVNHLFLQNNMNAAETFIKQFACAIPFDDSHYTAMERREGIFDYIDQGEAFINKVLREGLNLPISEYTGTPIADWIGKIANYGTGANFVIPGLLKNTQKDELKKICENPFIPVFPKSYIVQTDISDQLEKYEDQKSLQNRTQIFWDPRASLKLAGKTDKEIAEILSRQNMAVAAGKTVAPTPSFQRTEAFKDSKGKAHDSILSYLLTNIDPAFYKQFYQDSTNNPTAPSPIEAYEGWYEINIQPKVDIVWQDFAKKYEDLLSKDYYKALFGTKYDWTRYFRNRFGRDGTFDFKYRQHAESPALVDMANYNKSTSDNVIEDYIHELERYISILDLLYGKMIEKQNTIISKTTQKLSSMNQPIAPVQNSFYVPEGFLEGQSAGKFSLAFSFLQGLGAGDLDINSIPQISYTHDLKGINSSVQKNKTYFKYYLLDLKNKTLEMLDVLKNGQVDGATVSKSMQTNSEVPQIYTHQYRAYNEIFGHTLAYLQRVAVAMGVGPGDSLTNEFLKRDKEYRNLTKADSSLGVVSERMLYRFENSKIKPFYDEASAQINGTRYLLGIIGLEGLSDQDKSGMLAMAQKAFMARNEGRLKELQEIEKRNQERFAAIQNNEKIELTAEEKKDVEQYQKLLDMIADDEIDLTKTPSPLPVTFGDNRERYGIADGISYGTVFKKQVNVTKDCRKQEELKKPENLELATKAVMLQAIDACLQKNIGESLKDTSDLEKHKAVIKSCQESGDIYTLDYYKKYLGFQADISLLDCRNDFAVEGIEHKKELMLASAVTNQIYTLLEDIYSQVLFLKASDPKNIYRDHLENTPSKPRSGRGSRSNM